MGAVQCFEEVDDEDDASSLCVPKVLPCWQPTDSKVAGNSDVRRTSPEKSQDLEQQPLNNSRVVLPDPGCVKEFRVGAFCTTDRIVAGGRQQSEKAALEELNLINGMHKVFDKGTLKCDDAGLVVELKLDSMQLHTLTEVVNP